MPAESFTARSQRYRHALWMSDPSGEPPSLDSGGCRFHSVAWNELPKGVPAEKIDGVVLSDDEVRHKSIPAVLSRLPNLRWVSLDAHQVASLNPRAIPRLTELVIAGTRKVELPPGPWNSLHTVRARDATLTLRAHDLPALERLELLFDGKRALQQVAALKNLWGLQVGPVKDDATLAALTPLALTTLIFKRGSIGSLKGLARWPRLATFGAILCNDIRDLSPLGQLRELTEVSFNACAGLENVDSLLELPKLARVVLWGCRDDKGALARLIEAMRKKGVAVESEIGSCR